MSLVLSPLRHHHDLFFLVSICASGPGLRSTTQTNRFPDIDRNQFSFFSGNPSEWWLHQGLVCHEDLPHSQHPHHHDLVLEKDYHDDQTTSPAGEVRCILQTSTSVPHPQLLYLNISLLNLTTLFSIY